MNINTFWKILIFLVPAGLMALDINKQIRPMAEVTVHVTDQDGNPVADASVKISGTLYAIPDTLKDGKTNNRGLFHGEIRSNGEINVVVEKDGYYRSEYSPAYNYRMIFGAVEKAHVSQHWEPRNPMLEVVLKRIIHPIPMFTRRIVDGLPTHADAVGYDLFEGDFVAPYGRGKTPDWILKSTFDQQGEDEYDYRLTVEFQNTLDGIQPFKALRTSHGSDLRSPYTAPIDGYLSKWVVLRSRHAGSPDISNFDPPNHAYFFRVRTVVNERGEIISAIYGKIYGDFMSVTYYLNPTSNDRNVEFDPKQNLFKNLQHIEEVNEP